MDISNVLNSRFWLQQGMGLRSKLFQKFLVLRDMRVITQVLYFFGTKYSEIFFVLLENASFTSLLFHVFSVGVNKCRDTD